MKAADTFTLSPKRRSASKAALAVVGAGLVLTLAGCASAPLAIINATAPTYGVAITHSIAYTSDPGERHTLDVYAPRKSRPGAPVVVFLYGGGWDSGKKADYKFVGAALASHGYLAVLPDYRLYPQVRYPAFLQDSAAAVRWTRDHAADYGFDPRQLFLMGHSAGAYNAVMLATDRQWLAAVGMDPKRDVRGVVGLAGPYDFLPLESDELKAIFGPENQRPATQPINHITGNEPPFFLAHDLGDKVVYVKNTQNFAAKAKAAGDQVQTRYYKGLSHALLMGAVAAPLRFLGPVFRDLTDFIDRTAQGAASSAPGPHAAAAPARRKAAA
jgi:acetyl esterase/lipase